MALDQGWANVRVTFSPTITSIWSVYKTNYFFKCRSKYKSFITCGSLLANAASIIISSIILFWQDSISNFEPHVSYLCWPAKTNLCGPLSVKSWPSLQVDCSSCTFDYIRFRGPVYKSNEEIHFIWMKINTYYLTPWFLWIQLKIPNPPLWNDNTKSVF